MKRSLPVMLGLAAVLVIAGLVGGGFLSLPSIGDDSSAQEPGVHDPAPRVDPEPMKVDYGQDDSLEMKKKKDKDGKKDRKGKDDRGRNGDREKKGDGNTPRKNREGNRSTPKGQDQTGIKNGAQPVPPKKGGPKKEPQPSDPQPVTVTDLRGDPEGEGSAPAYVDLETVRLQATGDLFIAELTFAGRIPTKMPNDGTATLASIEVDRRGKQVSVYAEASDDGWRAHTNRSAEFPGSLEIDGRTLRFTLARSFFGNEFSWYAHSSWTKSSATDTDYFFDFAPDDRNGRFPSGGTT